MGCTQSSASAEHSRSRALDARVENDHEQDRLRVKLLLLGAGESGKSTLFKQMRILYGKGWSDGERKAFAPIIAGNVLSSMRTLCQKASELGNVLEPAVRDAAAMVAALPEGSRSLDAHMARAVAALWADDGIRATFAARARFQLLDSAPYYLNKVTELAAPGYIPTTEDVLKSRVQTTSVVEETFVIDGVPFTIIDVGGQRNERKKWIHQFDAVTAVIFVASLSEYDQCLAEDGSVNRMVEAMELFAEVANSKWCVQPQPAEQRASDAIATRLARPHTVVTHCILIYSCVACLLVVARHIAGL